MMHLQMLYPLKMQPVFKEIIWGGTRLRELYGKAIPSDETGEAWEVCSHNAGESVVENGSLAGKTIKQLIAEYPVELLGTAAGDMLPLMFKIIDANDKLSVQVHPNDEYARIHENGELGKTELWYVLDAKPNSKLVYSVKDGVSKHTFENAQSGEELEACLNYVSVKKGDVFFIPAGIIHAIGEGILIAEIQQNSNTTYRVYDYNRKDKKTGRERELHKEQAYDVIDYTSYTGREQTIGERYEDGGNIITKYVKCDYFSFDKYEITEQCVFGTDGRGFEILFISEGEGEILHNTTGISFKAGDTFLIPATTGTYTLCGKCEVLKFYV